MSVPEKHTSDCMVCGAELKYDQDLKTLSCSYCGNESETNTFCSNDHFVCDACHAKDAVTIIKDVCLNSTEKDMIKLLETIRSHPSFPLHGPEHHAMVPGIILSTYRNLGGEISDKKIEQGIARGAKIPGGYCGFIGTCGAAMGVGAAFAIILEASPLKPGKRQLVLQITTEVLQDIAKNRAARCCQRESVIALQKAAKLSEKYLDIKLLANDRFICSQNTKNKECIKTACSFWHDTQ